MALELDIPEFQSQLLSLLNVLFGEVSVSVTVSPTIMYAEECIPSTIAVSRSSLRIYVSLGKYFFVEPLCI